MLEQLFAMVSNNLHLLSKLDNGVQLFRIGILDQLALDSLQLSFGGGSVLLNVVEFALEQPGFGRPQFALGGIEDLGLEICLAPAHLAERVVLGAQVLYLFTEAFVL